MNQKNFYDAFRDDAPLVFQQIRNIPYQVGLNNKAQIDHLLKGDFSSTEIAENIQQAGCSEKNLILGSYLENLYINSADNVPFNVQYVVTQFHWKDIINKSNWELLSLTAQVTVGEVLEYLENIIPHEWKKYQRSWKEEVESIMKMISPNNQYINLYSLVSLTFPSYHFSLSINLEDNIYALDATWNKDLEKYGFSVDTGLGVKPIDNESHQFNHYSKAVNYKKTHPIQIDSACKFTDINLIFYVAFNIALLKICSI